MRHLHNRAAVRKRQDEHDRDRLCISVTKSRRRLDKIRVGAYLAVMDKVGEWYEVDVNGWHGFVKDANVTLDAPLPD